MTEHAPDQLETSVAGGSRLAALRWLAKSRGVPLGFVLEKASQDRLRAVVELRARTRFSPSRPGWGVKTGDDALLVLAFKRHPVV
jgi:hypothetical protein